MAIIRILPADRNAMLAALRTAWDSGAGACTLRFYSGAMPAGPTTAPAGGNVLLGTVTFSDPIGGEAGGVLTMGAFTQDNEADATGVASWCRVIDGDGNARADLDVTDLAGSGAVKLNTVNIVAGGPIRVASATITQGGGF